MSYLGQAVEPRSGRGRRALVIGGSGPTGPLVVNGLLQRGYAVSVLSTGKHPATFAGEVERITSDPHFAEPLEQALRGRQFDVTLAQYGRLRVVAAALAGRTDQFIAISARAYPGWLDPATMQRPDGKPSSLAEQPLRYYDEARPVPETTPLVPVGRFDQRIIEADNDVRLRHQRGDFSASILRYPKLYGPRQGAAVEWSILRRLIDGRRRLLAPEGGFLIRSVLFNENAARIVLGCVDNPAAAAGEAFNCADPEPLTLRKWMRAIAEIFGCEVELVSLPMAMAVPAWAYARFPLAVGHQILDTQKLSRLGIEFVPSATALRRTIEWYLEDVSRGHAVESALRDTFNYALEDKIMAEIDRAQRAVEEIVGDVPAYVHPHIHPRAPGDDAR
jgi:nucleoside-diphosphate-sugar epimerase